MLVSCQLCRQHPVAGKEKLGLSLPVNRIDAAAALNHLNHLAVALVPYEIVSLAGAVVSGFGVKLPSVTLVVPAQNAAQSVFPLLVDIVLVVAIVDAQHGHAPGAGHIPCIEAEAVAVAGIVVGLLQYVEVADRTATVGIDRILAVDLLVVVAVSEVVATGCIYCAGRNLPVVVSPCKTKELVESAIRTNALHGLEAESLVFRRLGGQHDRTSETAARHAERRSTVQQRSVVDKIRRNH